GGLFHWCYHRAARRNSMSLRHSFIAFVCLLVAWVTQAEPLQSESMYSPEQDVREVFDLMQARLSVMPAVAAWKFANNAPVTDAAREQKVIDATVADAQRLGIDGAGARELFVLQIRMARDVQEHFISTWRQQGGNKEPV